MPRRLLQTILLGLLIGGPLSSGDWNPLTAAECQCRKCVAGRLNKCKECRGCQGCNKCASCGKLGRLDTNGQRVPSLHDAVNSPGAYCQEHQYGRPDLFYNYYLDPTCGAVSAQMYLAPRPVPPLVGHTYYTYQPLMPHEFLYPHHRTYHRYYDGGRGLTRTKVVWYPAPLQALGECIKNAVEIPR